MSFLLQLNEALSQKDQKKLMKEWRELSAELGVLAPLVKKMSARVSEIEAQLLPLVKEAEGQKEVIDNAILQYSQSKGRSTVSYSDLWNETLKVVNEDQKAVLEAFKESITKVGAGSENLKVVDPKLEKILSGIHKDMDINELKKALTAIVKLPTDDTITEASIIDKVKKAVKFIIDCFSTVKTALKTSKKSADKLAKLAAQAE